MLAQLCDIGDSVVGCPPQLFWYECVSMLSHRCPCQVGAGGLKSSGGTTSAAAVSGIGAGRAPMTMSEVLGVLWAKSVTEAEEAQRLLISALNGLAALLLIDGDKAGAVSG